jgi:sirohydrochlorin cobaltochelatase
MKAIILFAHGSNDPKWHEPIQTIAQLIQQSHFHVLVRCAYLEITPPGLKPCVEELLALGCNDITVLPMFLGLGRHAREDLPKLCEEIQVQHPELLLKRLPFVGQDPRVLTLLANLATEHL